MHQDAQPNCQPATIHWAAELDALLTILARDVISLAGVETLEAEVQGRAVVRAMFSHVEAYLYTARQVALMFSTMGWAKFSVAELVCLNEKRYWMSRDGEAESGSQWLEPAKAAIKFTFTVVCRELTDGYAPPFHDHRWKDLQDSIEIRNRLTHPKRLSDCAISPDDLLLVERGHNWFLDTAHAFAAANAEWMEKQSAIRSQAPRPT